MKLYKFILITLLLTACAPVGSTMSLQKEPEVIKIPLQPARNIYATVRTLYGDMYRRGVDLCKRSLISEKDCVELAKMHQETIQLDFEIRRQLDNPKAELDIEKIEKILGIVAKIASMVPLPI